MLLISKNSFAALSHQAAVALSCQYDFPTVPDNSFCRENGIRFLYFLEDVLHLRMFESLSRPALKMNVRKRAWLLLRACHPKAVVNDYYLRRHLRYMVFKKNPVIIWEVSDTQESLPQNPVECYLEEGSYS